MSAPESPVDHHRIRCCMVYPETESVKFHGLIPHLQKKTHLSSHCKPHHLMSVHLPDSLIHSASLPDGKYSVLCKYSVKIHCPDRHPLNFENLCHCSLQPDRLSYPDRSLHSKMYSENLSLIQ